MKRIPISPRNLSLVMGSPVVGSCRIEGSSSSDDGGDDDEDGGDDRA